MPARAEVVRLRCNENPPGSPFAMTIDVDLTKSMVFTVFDIGVNQTQNSPAQITDRFITWRVMRDSPADDRLDRATGLLTWSSNGGQTWLSAGSCHRIQGNVL